MGDMLGSSSSTGARVALLRAVGKRLGILRFRADSMNCCEISVRAPVRGRDGDRRYQWSKDARVRSYVLQTCCPKALQTDC